MKATAKVAFITVVTLLLLVSCNGIPASQSIIPQTGAQVSTDSVLYLEPVQNAQFVSVGTTITVRYGPTLTSQDLSNINFNVQGAQSGSHTGQTILADDNKTVIFKPDQPFGPGEQVSVDITPNNLDAKGITDPTSYTFTTAVGQKSGMPGADNPITQITPPPGSPHAFPNYLTLPNDVPPYQVSIHLPGVSDGYVFVAPYRWGKPNFGSYLLIMDNNGDIVWYKSVADQRAGYDFKVQPNGLITYFSTDDAVYHVLDSRYNEVATYKAGNGLYGDLHEFLMLPNGHVMFTIYDGQMIDMSKYVQGGNPQANVIGTVIQEQDRSGNVVWEWRSWDHIPFTETWTSLTADTVDYVHGNALSFDLDGNLLLSSRNLSEIKKINYNTRDVIWTLGGKANNFKFINEDELFGAQHDIRVLPNGNITLFDNGETAKPSRGVEYQLDQNNMTATKVWQYQSDPPVWAQFMGDIQRLSNGNSFLEWGSLSSEKGYAYYNMTEVDPNNNVVWQVAFDQPYVSYRGFRYNWMGFPDTQPDLAYQNTNGTLTLGYSWNGSTEVAQWRLLGGSSPSSLQQVDQQAKAGFETQLTLQDAPADQCYYQAVPIDSNGVEMTRSPIVSTNETVCPPVQ